jgi:hypothetical protein
MDAISTGLQVYGGGGIGAGLSTAGAAAAPTESLTSQTAAEAAPEAAKNVAANLANNPAVEGAVTPDLTSAATNNANFVGYQEGQVSPSLAAGDPGANFVGKTGMGVDAGGNATGFGWDEGINPQTGQLTGDTAQRLANAPGTPEAVSTPQTPEQLRASFKPENLAKTEENIQDLSASERGRYALEGLKHPGAVYDTMSMGETLGATSGLMQGFKEEPKKFEQPRPVYYIRDPKTGKPLYEEGTVNPNLSKLGYIPVGESYFQGQQFNPGVYSYNPEKYEPVDWDKITNKNMRRGGLASLHYDGGGSVPKDTGQKILASNQPLPQGSSGGQSAMQGMNQYFGNQYANAQQSPAFQAPNLSVTPYTPPENVPLPPSSLNAPTQIKDTSDWMSNFNTKVSPPVQEGSGVKPPATSADWINNFNTKVSPSVTPSVTPPTSPMVESRADPEYTGAFNMAAGGLANLGGTYAAGGKLLRGPGDGMSDSIPAVIGGKKPQRAALADGEFVVPADVVSHLGNGSTEAGSRKLYAMMDKIRHARTGKKKQAPAVKAERYMPK